MKKLMIMSAVAALAIGAQATLSYGIGYELNTGYDGKHDMVASDLGYYSLYSLSSAEISTITGKTGTDLTADSVTTWLKENNYYSKKSQITSVASAWEIKTDGLVSDVAQTKSSRGFLLGALKGNDVTVTDNDWAILFFNNGGEDSFRVAQATKTNPEDYNSYNKVGDGGSVIGLAEGGFLYRGNPGNAVSYGGWKTVPEPTSGLLLLLGVAGLALKRKRA